MTLETIAKNTDASLYTAGFTSGLAFALQTLQDEPERVSEILANEIGIVRWWNSPPRGVGSLTSIIEEMLWDHVTCSGEDDVAGDNAHIALAKALMAAAPIETMRMSALRQLDQIRALGAKLRDKGVTEVADNILAIVNAGAPSHPVYKVCSLDDSGDAYSQGRRTRGDAAVCYQIGARTLPADGCGPLTAYATLDDAIYNVDIQKQFVIFECVWAPSTERTVWTDVEHDVIDGCPFGTIFCDNLTPIRAVYRNDGQCDLNTVISDLREYLSRPAFWFPDEVDPANTARYTQLLREARSVIMNLASAVSESAHSPLRIERVAADIKEDKTGLLKRINDALVLPQA